ncbi:hypothetical protein RMATCC62417_11252 [Rhizopus microsporus]|nr:hypothetical protein RMATCC62417_11252 [Rhizopus microsporus]
MEVSIESDKEITSGQSYNGCNDNPNREQSILMNNSHTPDDRQISTNQITQSLVGGRMAIGFWEQGLRWTPSPIPPTQQQQHQQQQRTSDPQQFKPTTDSPLSTTTSANQQPKAQLTLPIQFESNTEHCSIPADGILPGGMDDNVVCPAYILHSFLQKSGPPRIHLPSDHILFLGYLNKEDKVTSIRPPREATWTKHHMKKAGTNETIRLIP